MLKPLDSFLNKFTLFRLTLCVLLGLVLVAFISSFFGSLPFGPWDILLSSIVIVFVGITVNYIFAGIIEAKTNMDSVWISLLVLILIFPLKFPDDLPFVILAASLAMASKYLLTVEKRHIFNPAAVAAVAVTLLYPDRGATWWIGTPVLLPYVLLGGLLIIRKFRAGGLALTFLLTYLIVTALGTLSHTGSFADIWTGWQMGLTHSAILFFTFVMLTEPMTSPANKTKRLYFAALVSVLYSTIQLRISVISFTPEIALCLGNILAYFLRPHKTINNVPSPSQQPAV